MVFLTSLEGSRIYVIQLTRCFIYFSIFHITAKRLHWGHHWPNAQKYNFFCFLDLRRYRLVFSLSK